MRLRLVSVLVVALLTVTSLSPSEAAQRPREGAWNGFSTATVGGRIHSVAPTYGAPTFPLPPGGLKPDGCRLEIYVGPNPLPANPSTDDLRTVRFYKALPGYPPDICKLPRGWFVVITGELVTVLCEVDVCQFGVLNAVGKTIEVRR